MTEQTSPSVTTFRATNEVIRANSSLTLDGIELVRVQKVGQAILAYCDDCAAFLGSPYWSLAKSVWLHKHNPHTVTFWTLPA